MATLQLDIKPNDALAKSALEAAKALDKVAAAEAKANGRANAITASLRKSGAAAVYFNRETAAYGKVSARAHALASKATDTTKKKERDVGKEAKAQLAQKKKDSAAQKERNKIAEGMISIAKGTAAAIVGATTAAAALGAALAVSAKHAAESKAGALALMNAWTHGRGEETLKRVDAFANKVGMSTEDAREKFVEYRKTSRWVTNQAAADLLKLRADIIAVSKSSAIADEEIGSVLANADNPAMFAMKLAEVKRAYGGVGDGARAASAALESVDAAQNRLSNAFGESMSKLWSDIGPAIGRAANRLADFATEVMRSEQGQAALKGIADAFREISAAINKENLTTALNAIRATAEAVSTVIGGISKFNNIEKAAGQRDRANAALEENARALEEKRAEILGRSVADGIASGIASGETTAASAGQALADVTSEATRKALGIHSPSKVFEGFGRQTVEGFRRGEESELGQAMPLQEAVAVRPESAPAAGAKTAGSAPSIVIEKLTVSGGNGDPEEIARSIRQELQMLLQAGQLARGFA